MGKLKRLHAVLFNTNWNKTCVELWVSC